MAARYIIDHYYGGRTDNLSEQDRQQISMLATIASGIAGGLAGNSTASAGTGAQAGKNAVENNSLATIIKVSEEALEACVKNATCRGAMHQMGIAVGLTREQVEEAMRAGASRDPARIAKLTPEQIEYLDEQITGGKGMAREMFGSQTWGDRLTLPIADKDPTGGKLENPGHQGRTGYNTYHTRSA